LLLVRVVVVQGVGLQVAVVMGEGAGVAAEGARQAAGVGFEPACSIRVCVYVCVFE